MSKIAQNAAVVSQHMAQAQNAAGGTPMLGAYVWWELNNSLVRPDDLRVLFAKHGETLKVPDIKGPAAVKAAAARWTTDRFAKDKAKTELVREDAERLDIGVLVFERITENEVGWVQREIVSYDVRADTWLTTPTSDHGQVFVAYADRCREFLDHRWLRPSWVKARILGDAKGVPLKNNGGFFFVFADNLPVVYRLKAAVQELGKSDVLLTEVYATPNSQAAVGSAVRESLSEQFAELREAISGWKQNVRRSSLEKVLTEFEDLRARADLYSAVLNFRLDELNTEMEEAVREVRARLEGGDDTPKSEDLAA